MQKVFEFLHSGSALAFARVPGMTVDLFNGLQKYDTPPLQLIKGYAFRNRKIESIFS
jgi:hypothetical protein